MQKTARKLLSLLIILAFALNALPLGGVQTVQAAVPSVVISQIYGGGGNTGAPYTYDFIELFNPGSEPVTLNGWSLQYGSPTGTFGSSSVTELNNVTIDPGEYFLVQEGTSSTAVGIPLPTADLIDTTNMGGTNGKVALVTDTEALGCYSVTSCGPEKSAKIIDLVGYGTATWFRGAAAPALTNSTAAVRNGAGCVNSGNNGADFTAAAPTPRNSASPINLCSAPASLTLSINDVTKDEGDTGTTSFDFTVSLNMPAGAGGVTFDITTADGSATTADTDYVTKSLNSQTIPAGSASYTFSVMVNGDEAAEADETFAVNITNPSGATLADGSGVGKIVDDDTDHCALPFTPINTIQGSGTAAAQTGMITTQGVVVGDFEANPLNPGFFIQDIEGDGSADTSDGLFVLASTADLVSVGQVVRITGYARERFNQTTLNGSNSNTAPVPAQNIIQCGTATVAPVDVSLPFADATAAERYEGMLVRFPQTLYVTDTFALGRYGQVTVSSTNRLFQPTAQELPGSPAAVELQAANTRNQIIVDDGNDLQNVEPIAFGRGGNPLHNDNTLRGGDTINGLVGVFNYSYSEYRVNPVGAMGGFYGFEPTNQRSTSAPSVDGTLKISAFNTLNYFNTFTGCTLGVGGGATDCRGANSAAEYDRQWRKTVQAIIKLDADVLGINEIENDGYGPESAIADLVNKLNEATAPGTYDFIDVDSNTGQVNALGTDAIKVGIIYKPEKVTYVGSTAVLNTGAFGQYLVYEMAGDEINYSSTETIGRNRPSLVQAFEENISDGERVVVSVNHLKSKGSSCANNISPVGPDPDTGDGQGNCNLTRKAATTELMNWLASDPTDTGETDILILGDLNSYTFEDPIIALTNGGYTNLILDRLGEEAYSYSFDGQWGYLDHALASSSLNEKVQGVGHYHTNADEPTVFDYNVEFKSVQQHEILYAENEFRASDHDATLVGLDLASIPVNTAPVAVDDTYETDEDEALTVAAPGVLANDTDGEGDTLTTTLDVLPQNGAVEMETSGQFTYTPDEDFHGVDTFTYTVSDGELTGTATVTIEVESEDDDPEAADDAYETDEDSPLTVPAPGVLANDSDVDGDTLTLSLITGPLHGMLVLNADGSFLYTPIENFNGEDSFTYNVSDGQQTDTGTVTITVNAVDDLPYAVITTDNFFPEEGEAVNFTASLFDPDTNQPIAFSTGAVVEWNIGSGPAIPGVSINPTFSEDGSYNVALTVSDPQHGASEAELAVTVVNAAPVINLIMPIAIAERGWVNQAVIFSDAGVNDTWTATADFGDGTGVQALDWKLGTFDLSHQYFTSGEFTITIVVSDDDGGEDTLTVTVTVEGRQILFLPVLHH